MTAEAQLFRLSPAARALKGLRITEPVPAGLSVTERPVPPAVEVTTMAQLVQLVTDRQRHETETGWDAESDPLIVWLQIGPAESLEEALALKEMAAAYGIHAGWRQLTEPTATPAGE